MNKKTKLPATLFDFCGKEILIGDIVVYGKSLGRCAGLNIGVVLETYKSKGKYNEDYSPRIALLSNTDSWTDFPNRTLDIKRWGGASIKKITNNFSDRMLVIDPEQLGNSEMARFFIDKWHEIKENNASRS